MSLGEDLRNLGNSYKAEKMGLTPAEVASTSEWKCKSIPSSLQPAPEKMPAISRYSLNDYRWIACVQCLDRGHFSQNSSFLSCKMENRTFPGKDYCSYFEMTCKIFALNKNSVRMQTLWVPTLNPSGKVVGQGGDGRLGQDADATGPSGSQAQAVWLTCFPASRGLRFTSAWLSGPWKPAIKLSPWRNERE